MMVTSFGCSCVDGCGAAQSSSQWGSCKVLGKVGEGRINDRGILMEVEGAGVGGSVVGCVGVDMDGVDGVGSGGGVQCCW